VGQFFFSVQRKKKEMRGEWQGGNHGRRKKKEIEEK
jgi:hypothetical protein